MNKERLRQKLVEELEDEKSVLEKALAVAYDATTHDDAKSEGKYDTRATESGYLAGAQANRLQELESQIIAVQNFKLESFSSEDPIAISALVQVGSKWLFIVPQAGGRKIEFEGLTVLTITPMSQKGRSLIDLYPGDEDDAGQAIEKVL